MWIWAWVRADSRCSPSTCRAYRWWIPDVHRGWKHNKTVSLLRFSAADLTCNDAKITKKQNTSTRETLGSLHCRLSLLSQSKTNKQTHVYKFKNGDYANTYGRNIKTTHCFAVCLSLNSCHIITVWINEPSLIPRQTLRLQITHIYYVKIYKCHD